jgi:hypothetical protein
MVETVNDTIGDACPEYIALRNKILAQIGDNLVLA